MHRLEMTAAFEECSPQWRSYVGESQRAGTPLGWVDTDTAPAGVQMASRGTDEQNSDAVPLTWQAGPLYLILRTPEAPELQVRGAALAARLRRRGLPTLAEDTASVNEMYRAAAAR